MSQVMRHLTIAVSALALFAIDAAALAQPKDKGAGEQKAKRHEHHDGKSLLGDKIKTDGRHEFHKHGKFTASADVRGGKIAGISVRHAEKGDVPVKKYKTNQKMAELTGAGLRPALIVQAQYVGTTYIGYSYIDDYGNEVIYWFPYDMVLDPYTGAIDYVPAY